MVRSGSGFIVVLLLLAVMPASGAQGNDNSFGPSISGDGRNVTFYSDATNLVTGDTNGYPDIYMRDRIAGKTFLLSRTSAGAIGNDNSIRPSISFDGVYVAFESVATNLVPGDSNGYSDIFVRDRKAGKTFLVSRTSAGVIGNDDSFDPSVSGDGRLVAFESVATNLVPGDTNGYSDIFVRDRQTGATSLVSRTSAGVIGNDESFNPSISANGRFVAFDSVARNLVPGDTNGYSDIFVRDRQTGATSLVSRNSTGGIGNDDSFNPSISDDGRFVAFESVARNLVATDTNGYSDIFVRDRKTGKTYMVSRTSAGVIGNDNSFNPSISTDGRFVAFESAARNLVPGDTNNYQDIFVRDRQTGATSLVSRNSTGGIGNDESFNPSISADGRFVAFESAARNLVPGDTNNYPDIFVRDRQTGTTSLVSRN
jgi:Tol biopolymer transport system component